MIKMIKLHFYYLFSWKVVYVSLIIVLISTIIFLTFSKFYLDYDLLIFNSKYYREGYYFESINYLKIVIVLYNMFLVINAFILNKYDVFLLARRTRFEVISSKVLVLIIISSILTIMLYLIFLVTGQFLTPFMNISNTDMAILGDLIIFSVIYLLLFISLYFYGKGLYSLLIIVVGYFISDIAIDYYEPRNSVNILSKIINFVFVNIGYYEDIGYSLYYGKIWGIILIIILFQLIIFRYLKTDIEN